MNKFVFLEKFPQEFCADVWFCLEDTDIVTVRAVSSEVVSFCSAYWNYLSKFC